MKNKKIISILLLMFTIIILIMIERISERNAFAMSEGTGLNEVSKERIDLAEESQAKASSTNNIEKEDEGYKDNNKLGIDIKEIIEKNLKETEIKELCVEEKDLEYITKYKKDASLPQGMIQVEQEGVIGKQKVITQKIYENNEFIKEELIGSKIEKSSINKIVKIGTSEYTSTYKVKVGDTVYLTAKDVGIMQEPSVESNKLVTIKKDSEMVLKEISGDWYKIKYEKYIGWIKGECLTYLNPNTDNFLNEAEMNKQTILRNLNFQMALNKESGLSLEQFKKVLSNDSNDKNKVFEQNAQYFYYIEKQYKVNGVFVAAVGIHESAWGTSKISKNKNNLFGYGAYDSSPYSSSYSFENYAEGIDLLGRVFVKYYLNPKGTQIYDGQVATGGNYNGNTLSAVNKKYATDKNWANAVYKWMEYLYNRL